MRNRTLLTLKKALESAQTVVISTHQLPDGDGLGAEVALCHFLKQLKKKCWILNPDPAPQRYRFLESKHCRFLTHPCNQLKDLPDGKCDLWIILDTNDPRRLGPLWDPLSQKSKKILFIDHHQDLGKSASRLYPRHSSLVSNRRVSSIAEILYPIFIQLGMKKLDPALAKGLYVSVMTDTNSFRYSRTTALAHQIASEAISSGINPEEIYRMIYSSKKVSHVQLLGTLFQNIKSTPDEKIAWIAMDASLRKRFQAASDDTQSFLNFLLIIQSAEILISFREEDSGKIRVSLKSKGKWEVHPIAKFFGGGGHRDSAGFELSGKTLKEVETAVIKKILASISSR